MNFDDRGNEGETQPGACGMLALFATIKAFEHIGSLGDGDAGASVTDLNYRSKRCVPERELDSPAVGSKFDRIIE